MSDWGCKLAVEREETEKTRPEGVRRCNRLKCGKNTALKTDDRNHPLGSQSGEYEDENRKKTKNLASTHLLAMVQTHD